jgi:hypothetical protein
MTTDLASMTVAELVAHYLTCQNVSRVYGLVGGHIQPMWDAAARAGLQIVDVRHEGAAVHMAHAEAELTGQIGVAMGIARTTVSYFRPTSSSSGWPGSDAGTPSGRDCPPNSKAHRVIRFQSPYAGATGCGPLYRAGQ